MTLHQFTHAYCTSGTQDLRASYLTFWHGVGAWTVHRGWRPSLPMHRWLGCRRSFQAGDGVLWNQLPAGPPSMNPHSQLNRTAHEWNLNTSWHLSEWKQVLGWLVVMTQLDAIHMTRRVRTLARHWWSCSLFPVCCSAASTPPAHSFFAKHRTHIYKCKLSTIIHAKTGSDAKAEAKDLTIKAKAKDLSLKAKDMFCCPWGQGLVLEDSNSGLTAAQLQLSALYTQSAL